MRTRNFLYIFFLVIPLLCNCAFAQSSELEKLKAILKATEAIANENEMKAIAARREADRQRYLKTTHEVAEKSLEVGDRELRALLALQAFNFNSAHDGYRYENVIYNSLQSSLAQYSEGTILKGHHDQIIFIHEDENRLLSIAVNGEVLIRNKSDSSIHVLSIPIEKNSTINCAQITADGYSILVETRSAAKAYVCLYQLSESFSLDKKIEVNSNIKSLQFSTSDHGFYYIDNSVNAVVYSDFISRKELYKSKERILKARLNSDRTKMAVALEDNKILACDIENFNPAKSIQVESKSTITAVEWAKDRNFLFVGFDDGSWQIFDSGTSVRTLYNGLSTIEEISLSPTGSKVITINGNGEISIWNLRQMNESPLRLKIGTKISAVALSKDESLIYYSCVQTQKSDDNCLVHSQATSLESIAAELRNFPSRNLTAEEWQFFMRDLPYEQTLQKFPSNNKPRR